jgi:hypothetical protein
MAVAQEPAQKKFASEQVDSSRSVQKQINRGQVKLAIDIVGIKGIIRTHPKAILRELNVSVDDSISLDEVDEVVRRNQELIYNTGQFNRVEVQSKIEDGKLKLDLNVAERWYVWPELIFNLEDRSIQAWLRNPDLARVTYGVGLNWYNVTGRFDKVSLNYTQGFTNRYSIGYDRPFIFPKSKIGGGFSFQYLRNNEVLFGTDRGSLLRIKRDTPQLETIQGQFRMRKRFSQNHGIDVGFGYRTLNISEALNDTNPEFLSNQNRHDQYSTSEITFWYDTRDVRPFPLHGDRFQASLEMMGLIGSSTTSFNRLNVRYWRYRQIKKSRWFGAYGAQLVWLIGNRVPYTEKLYLQQANIRGFDNFTIDGSLLMTARSELRYEVMKRRIVTIKRLPRQFRDFPLGVYPFVFSDVGTVRDYTYSNNDNFYKNRLLAGLGAGLDVPTFYDNVIRFEVAVNNLGFVTGLFTLNVALR